ncbi:hypothetical protein [Terrisporobacter petrolearius]
MKLEKIRNPYDAYRLIKDFLAYSDREKFVVVCLDTKNQHNEFSILDLMI